jgi:hypothetical protein
LRWLSAALVVVSAVAAAQPSSDLVQKQLAMLAAEAQFFSALAKEQKDELDKLKAAPCLEKP